MSDVTRESLDDEQRVANSVLVRAHARAPALELTTEIRADDDDHVDDVPRVVVPVLRNLGRGVVDRYATGKFLRPDLSLAILN